MQTAGDRWMLMTNHLIKENRLNPTKKERDQTTQVILEISRSWHMTDHDDMTKEQGKHTDLHTQGVGDNHSRQKEQKEKT